MNDRYVRVERSEGTLVPPSRVNLEIFKRAKDGGSDGVLNFKIRDSKKGPRGQD